MKIFDFLLEPDLDFFKISSYSMELLDMKIFELFCIGFFKISCT